MTSRRGAERWAQEPDAAAPVLDVLVPTADRPAELAVTLAGLAAQDDPRFGVVISDQSEGAGAQHPAVQAMVRVLRAQGRPVQVLTHLPRRGVAEQRHFLLQQTAADAVLYLDDDVWLEPGQLGRMHDALETLGCGFVGVAVQGLSYLGDERPAQQAGFEPWSEAVEAERVRRGTPAYERWPLHNAANMLHITRELTMPERGWLAYKVAWIGGCVMFRRRALEAVGGFGFWEELPAAYAGEDVLAQWRVMERYGGAGLVPPGAVHLEAPTTIRHRPVEAYDVIAI